MASITSTTITMIIFTIFFITQSKSQLFPPSPQGENFGTCPLNPLQLGVCTNLAAIPDLKVGDSRAQACCTAVSPLPNIQVADCLCYIFRPLPLIYPLDKTVRTIFFACNRIFPIGFQCPPPMGKR